ncbi:uncharacterized protein APUU_10187S [Aspergillus puulaauensis]|uniref:Uncharacterized protein n=1 Tax=Aspergillus puulaauensis TaxID=1220207 RepID=A0A7R7X9U8_9EURO|nr:uncharacterized protein APUU_10187S [Aspergillus puulaauensis]BCS17359.1 hypothetical protein APUU_10187S [Aspergillus puulaauensis]
MSDIEPGTDTIKQAPRKLGTGASTNMCPMSTGSKNGPDQPRRPVQTCLIRRRGSGRLRCMSTDTTTTARIQVRVCPQWDLRARAMNA